MSSVTHDSTYDVAILGAGFAGALTAMIALKKGCRVILIEKGKHPRITIGESTTPLTNLLLEDIATEHDLPILLNFTQYGKWKKKHPQLRVGLKRGFTFYNHQSTENILKDDLWNRELLVAASPNDLVSDTQWWREDWDTFLVDECKKLGVEYWDLTTINHLKEENDEITFTLDNGSGLKQIKTRLLIDACGGSGGVGSILNIRKTPLTHTPKSFAVFGHFNNVQSFQYLKNIENTRKLPYLPESSAIHHVIKNGWIWSLRFDHGAVSAGAVLSQKEYGSIQGQSPESIWKSILTNSKELNRVFKKSKPLYPLRKVNHVGFQMEQSAGNRWIMLASSAGFVDPLLSTGFPLTLQSIQRLAPLLSPELLQISGPLKNLRMIDEATKTELLIVDKMIGTLFATMKDFRHFSVASLIYFAAVSFSEIVRRLGKKQLAPGFLFSESASMRQQLLSIFDGVSSIQHSSESNEVKWKNLKAYVEGAIEPFNVIGLSSQKELPYFFAETNPLFEHADKLKSSPSEIKAMLLRSGFSDTFCFN